MVPRWAAAGVAAAALVAFGPALGVAVTASDGRVGDLVQEWLSARDFFAGHPAYSPSADALRRHAGVDAPDFGLAYNAHPPASVLLTLPLGLVSYPAAHAAWNVAGVGLLALSLWWLAGGAGLRVTATAVLLAAAAALAAHPLLLQFSNAQWNLVLLALGVGAWRADRAGHAAAAGLLVGTAAAVKLFPLFLLVYFAGAGRWRAAGVAVAAFAGWHVLTAGVLGPDALVVYVRDVVPSLTTHQSSWQNASVNGLCRRLFDPDPAENVRPLAHAPVLGRAAWVAASAGVAAVCLLLARRARTPADRDVALAAAAAGALVASPLTWSHAFVLLAGPAVLAWNRADTPNRRAGVMVAVAGLMLPVHAGAQLFLGPGVVVGLLSRSNDLLTPGESLLASAVPFLALVGLFALVATTRPRQSLSRSAPAA